MIQITENIVLLEVVHTYFTSGYCPYLKFIPDESSRQMMKRYGFEWRGTKNGAALFGVVQKSELQDKLTYIQKTTGQSEFLLNMITTDNEFYTYTEMPLQINTAGKLFYSTDKIDDGNELIPQLSQTINAVWVAQVSIKFSDLINNTAHFKISFKNRLAQWNYFVVNRSGITMVNPSIQSRNSEPFQKGEETQIETGEKAIRFTSGDHLIPLAEEPTEVFELVDNEKKSTATGRAQIIYKGLPNASANVTAANLAKGGQTYCANMYVYI